MFVVENNNSIFIVLTLVCVYLILNKIRQKKKTFCTDWKVLYITS